MDKLFAFGVITKVNMQTGMVDAIAADETLDHDREVYDYNSSKPYVSAWAEKSAQITKDAGQEVSYGSVRSMHSNKSAVGAVRALTFDDAAKAVRVSIEVVDKDELEKCYKGVLKGVSVCGRAVEKWRDGNATRYTLDPLEFSLVDEPCNPGAKFLAVKVDGSIEEREFETVEKRDFSTRRRKDLAAEGKALPDGSFPIENPEDLRNAIHAVGRAKDYEAAKRHIIARAKALGETGQLPAAWGSHEPDAEKLKTLLEDGAAILKRLSTETAKEAADMTEAEKAAAEVEKAKQEEIRKKAAKEKMQEAQRAHNDVGACVGGYCDHGSDTDKCMEKADEAHDKNRAAFGDDDEGDDAEKIRKAADRVAKAATAAGKQLEAAVTAEITLLKSQKTAADAEVAKLTAELAEAKSIQRAIPVLTGKYRTVSKDDKVTSKEDGAALDSIKKDDPSLLKKSVQAVMAGEEVLVAD